MSDILLRKTIEKAVIIIPVEDGKQIDEQEICDLTTSADAEVVAIFYAPIRIVTPSTYIGSGKAQEFKERIEEMGDVDIVVFDGELSPSQTLNLSDALGSIPLVDRTTLILDIFAKNAVSGEGKLQVELAQLRYLYPRLKGKGSALSRLGGGIGTRGPGETKLETDRRHIRTRILYLETRLKDLETSRALQRSRRKKNDFKTVALVGYTNVGKSTLMNALTDAGVLVKNQLFATLDPTVKKLRLPSQSVALIDTVGFVKNIPHHLIKAFRSTLESALEADLPIIVLDASSPQWQSQLETTQTTLKELGCLKEQLIVFNKSDLIRDFSDFPTKSLFISASKHIGLDKLLQVVDQMLSDDVHDVVLHVPFDQSGDFQKLYEYVTILNSKLKENETEYHCKIRSKYLSKFKMFL